MNEVRYLPLEIRVKGPCRCFMALAVTVYHAVSLVLVWNVSCDNLSRLQRAAEEDNYRYRDYRDTHATTGRNS